MLDELAPPNDVEIIGIVVNEKGAEGAIETGAVRTLGYPSSISEAFLRRNQNQSPDENQAVLRKIRERANKKGIGMVVYISMAFGNPYHDPWSKERLIEAVASIASCGVESISLADTVGMADQKLINEVVAAVIAEIDDPGLEIGVHLHSTHAGAAARCWRPTMPGMPPFRCPRSAGSAAVLLPRISWSATFRRRKCSLRWSSAAYLCGSRRLGKSYVAQ